MSHPCLKVRERDVEIDDWDDGDDEFVVGVYGGDAKLKLKLKFRQDQSSRLRGKERSALPSLTRDAVASAHNTAKADGEQPTRLQAFEDLRVL